jgi:hypothetical protein
MMLIYFILAAFPLSFLCGGRLKHIGENPLRLIWLPPLAFAVEAAFPLLKDRLQLPVSQWLWAAVLLEYALLFLFCFINWKRKSIRLIALACFLNFFVIAWYGFRMPVAPIIQEFPEMASSFSRIQSGEIFEYVLVEKNAPFLFLGDAIVIPFIHTGLASIGDIILGFGVSWLIFEWMRPLPQKKKRSSSLRSDTY